MISHDAAQINKENIATSSQWCSLAGIQLILILGTESIHGISISRVNTQQRTGESVQLELYWYSCSHLVWPPGPALPDRTDKAQPSSELTVLSLSSCDATEGAGRYHYHSFCDSELRERERRGTIEFISCSRYNYHWQMFAVSLATISINVSLLFVWIFQVDMMWPMLSREIRLCRKTFMTNLKTFAGPQLSH